MVGRRDGETELNKGRREGSRQLDKKRQEGGRGGVKS